MKPEMISQRSRCCILLDKTKIAQHVTRMCAEEVLLKNLEMIASGELCDVIRRFPNNIQEALLQEEETLQYVRKLVGPQIPIPRIERMLEQVPIKDLMRYVPGEVQEVLADLNIKSEYMGIYLKYYRKDGLSDVELSNLWEGLVVFQRKCTKLVDNWLEGVGEKRTLLMEPILTGNFLQKLQDYEGCLQILAEREEVLHLLNSLYQFDNGVTVLDEADLDEICANTRQLSELWNWAKGFFETSQLMRFLKLWLQNHALVYDLNFLKKKVESGEKVDIDSILMGRASYIAFFYHVDFSVKLGSAHEELVIYAITHKKKAFLNLVRENICLYQGISPHSVLFCRTFYDKCLNVNTMNSKNLAACGEMMDTGDIAWNLLAGRGHTFEELALIYSLSEEYIQLYESFSARRTDERLRVMREIVKKHCLTKGLNLEKLSEKLMQKPLSQWMQQELGHIQDLSYENAVRLLSKYEMFARLVLDMKNNAELRYVLDDPMKYQDFLSMEEIRRNSLENNQEWKYLVELFSFSDDFIAENQARTRQFIFEDGAHIMKIYCESQQEKKDDLRRLVSAELMGRFKELKYYQDDLSREIDYPVAGWQKKIWMENSREEQGELVVWEEDGLIPVMQAAIRLTKGTYSNVMEKTGPQIHFADFMEGNTGEDVHDSKKETKEYLTLFLERAYTAELPQHLMNSAYGLVLRLMRRKAKEMNAILTVSESYHERFGKELILLHYFMYISKSKAGEQYLDSLGGNNCVNTECSYKYGRFLMDRRNSWERKKI